MVIIKFILSIFFKKLYILQYNIIYITNTKIYHLKSIYKTLYEQIEIERQDKMTRLTIYI